MDRSNRLNAIAVIGIILIVAGALSLFGRVVGPGFAPFAAVAHWMHALAWPLVLIAIGVLLLTRDRTKATFGGLVRSRSDRVIGGVIGGIAERTGIDSNLARILFVVLTLFTGFGVGVVLYLAALILVPEASAAAVPVAPAPPAPPAPPVPSASQAAAAPAVPANQ